MEATWSRKEFSEKGGVADRKVLFYTEQGMFPDLHREVGRGTARIYTITELRDLRLILELTKFGLPLSQIKSLIVFVHSIRDKWLPNGRLIDQPSYVTRYQGSDQPWVYSQADWGSKKSVDMVSSPLMLQINLTAIFRGIEE